MLPTPDLSLPERQQQALTLCFAGQFAEAFALLQLLLDAPKDATRDAPRDAEPDAGALARTLNIAAIAALGLDRQDDALAFWWRCVEIKPDFVDAHHHLGILLKSRGRIAEAEAAWRQALAISPRHFEALSQLGDILRATGRLAEAERTYRLAVTLRPDHAGVLGGFGLVLAALKRFPEAEHAYRQVLELRPDHAQTHYRLGTALQAQNRLAEAASAYGQALRHQSDFVEAHNNLGCVLHALNRYEEAAEAFRRAIALRPDLAEAWHNFGSVMKELGRISEAEIASRAALTLNPNYGDARFGLAVLLLATGRFEEGWPLYEARYERPGFIHHASGKMLKCPQWRGEPLAGRSLLIWQEDGLGDMLQFGRYLPLLKASGAARIEVGCRRELNRIFAAHESVEGVMDHSEALEKSAGFDCWTSLMSVPLHMGTTLDTIPDAVWLKPEPALQAHWRERLDTLPPGPRIGFVWKGNPRHHNDAHRSAPSLATFARLWTVPGLNFVSLQKGQGEDEAQSPPASQPLLNLGAELQDFADTVAVVSQLDLVICVDTSTAHVAGALGKPCWVMLPGHDVDWRWLHGRDDSPWYPGTVRVFRQTQAGGWPALVGAVRKACAETFGAGAM
ncbi:tetratricopeptide repeat protein [Paraburkholderia acidipaludis]|uniref:tetratricopeptide repeat protein n=1 Tax=Paraburkholderia acidipaludis TaxID=660537 RepID=UPI0005B924F9|nr:tetratricopeptide repeat protein [Paraburkholderia acidipaludis]